MKVCLSARATGDLDRIYAYVYTKRGVQAADAFLERTRRATEFIGQHPEAGPHPNWTTRHRTLRFWPVSGTRFLIFYTVDENAVSIERVLDGRRDIVRLFEGGVEESFGEE